MRTASSLFLLTTLLFNLFGFYIAFTIEQREIKEEMIALLQDNNEEHLQLLTFSKQEYENIHWLKTGKEFRMNGKMYDVERIETDKYIIRLFVEEDEKELKLLHEFTHLFASQTSNSSNSAPAKGLRYHFLQDFVFPSSNLLLYVASTVTTFATQQVIPLSFISIGQSPPPDSFWS